MPDRDLPVGVYRSRHGRLYAYFSYREPSGLRKQQHLGSFNTVEEAKAARERAEIEHQKGLQHD
jgi:hypothetical protein